MASNGPLVSVIIPAYNCARYINEAIDSALAQTHQNCEVIVVDDGSTDGTGAAVAAYRDRVRSVRQQNRGVAAARNVGVGMAKGEFIAILDADDIWDADKIARQVEAFTAWKTAAAIGTCHRIIGETAADQPGDDIEFGLADVVEFCPFAASSIMVRRVDLLRLGLFDENLAGTEDLDLWIRLSFVGPLVRLGKTLLSYRDQPGGLSSQIEHARDAHTRTLAKHFATPAFRDKWKMKRVAEARLDREQSWLYFANGEKGKALRCLISSFIRWPFALRGANKQKLRLRRALLLMRILRARTA